MEVISQKLDDILAEPSAAHRGIGHSVHGRNVIDWSDGPLLKKTYTPGDVKSILDQHFDEGILICRLFLALSKISLNSCCGMFCGDKGIGVKSYKANPDAFIEDLLTTGLLDAMAVRPIANPDPYRFPAERLRAVAEVPSRGQAWPRRGEFCRGHRRMLRRAISRSTLHLLWSRREEGQMLTLRSLPRATHGS